MFNTSLQLDEHCHAQPRLTALLTCEDNIMPIAWHMPVSKSPFRYAIAIRKDNYTYQLIKKNKEFALNFLDFSHLSAFQKSGEIHGNGTNKFDICELSSKQALSIESNLIEEAYMIYECTLVDITSYGDHDLFIAEVNIILNKDTKDVNPTLFLGKGYYDTLTNKPQRGQRTSNE